MVPLLAPAWSLVAFLSVGALACVLWSLQLRFCTYHQSRGIVAAILGASVCATLAPSPWIGAFLLTVALALPISLLSLERKWTIALADPVQASGQLVMLSTWIVVLGVLTASMWLTTVWPLLGVLLVLSAYNNSVGMLQVYRGIKRWVWKDAAFGPIGEVVRRPTAFLHNEWKVAAINTILLPVGVSLFWTGNPWLTVAGAIWVALAGWHLIKADSLTCTASAVAGCLVVGTTAGFALPSILMGSLSLAVYPFARRHLVNDPRWEAWEVASRMIRRNHGLGIGLGGWLGMRVQTPKEGERIWMWLHNDWLETLLECGPLPVLCALGYLGTAAIRVAGGVSPLEAGLFGSLVALAVLSLGYMPWRTWPVNLFALGIVACWEATGR
jgi:hypothetical protein